MPPRKYPPVDVRLWSRVRRGPNCWEFDGQRNTQGYGQLRSRGRTQRAHRVAWELTNGPIPDGLHVLHHCDNPPCVRPDHLFLGTEADNAADRNQKGRWRVVRGEECGTARLTEVAVVECRARRREGALLTDLAKEWGVSKSAMGRAVKGQTWGHVA